MDTTVVIVFGFVYVGMILGEIPGLALDRTGIALLGGIALLVSGSVSPVQAWAAMDMPTLALLFGLMVVSAQLRLGGFYTKVTRQLVSLEVSPDTLLALLVAVAGVLSALLANDIICLAMAPVLVEGCARRRLNPVPFLLALACAANVGSAATLIGNPQNMLIGQVLRLSFAGYLFDAAVPALAGLVVVWLAVRRRTAGAWQVQTRIPQITAPPYDSWQSTKGLGVLCLLLVAFFVSAWPRDVLTLAAAGMLLTSRRMATRAILGLVDWQLLVLFMGLFVVNHTFAASGLLSRGVVLLTDRGISLAHPAWLFAATALLSNLVSNVPAVMLLLPAASHPMAGPALALASTLAGNLVIVGSIANIIVVDQAARLGIRITWKDHARVGVPVTLMTLLLAAAWLWLRSALASAYG